MRVNIHWAGGDARHTVGGRRWLARVARDLRVLCDAAGGKAVVVDCGRWGTTPPSVPAPGARARAGVSQLA